MISHCTCVLTSVQLWVIWLANSLAIEILCWLTTGLTCVIPELVLRPARVAAFSLWWSLFGWIQISEHLWRTCLTCLEINVFIWAGDLEVSVFYSACVYCSVYIHIPVCIYIYRRVSLAWSFLAFSAKVPGGVEDMPSSSWSLSSLGFGVTGLSLIRSRIYCVITRLQNIPHILNILVS